MHVLRMWLFAAHVRVTDSMIAYLLVCLGVRLLACLSVFLCVYLFFCVFVPLRVRRRARVFGGCMYAYTDGTRSGDDVYGKEAARIGSCLSRFAWSPASSDLRKNKDARAFPLP